MVLHLDVGPLGQDIFEKDHNDVSHDVTLVNLVQNHMTEM